MPVIGGEAAPRDGPPAACRKFIVSKMSAGLNLFATCVGDGPRMKASIAGWNRTAAKGCGDWSMPTESNELDASLRLPWDLTEWIEKPRLVRWINDEIARLNWSNSELAAHLMTHPDFQPRMMLTLLATSYLTALCESEDIVDRCYSDTTLREICGTRAAPQRQSIGRFRRENRGLLRWLIEQVLTRAIRAHFQAETGRLPAGLKRYLHENATERLELARHMDRAAQGA
jgi:hypothetical protein